MNDATEYVQITITDRIKWYERMNWLEAAGPVLDMTYWAAWAIGHDDINVRVPAEVAVLYYLVWGE